MKETENNFQTKTMIYKMKKIKKNRKNPNNLQNIQPLEVLENFQSNIEKENKEIKPSSSQTYYKVKTLGVWNPNKFT